MWVVIDGINKVTSSTFGARTLLRTSSLLSTISTTSSFLSYHAFHPFFTTSKVALPHSRIRFVTTLAYYRSPKGQGDLIRTCYQEMPKSLEEYRVILRVSVMFNQFCNENSNDIGHCKYLADLRRQSKIDLFFNKASTIHPNLFRMTYETLKHHGFDRPPYLPPNSRYSRKVPG